jgi:translation initiation factor 2 alpha subunit (eIF-2alpha)
LAFIQAKGIRPAIIVFQTFTGVIYYNYIKSDEKRAFQGIDIKEDVKSILVGEIERRLKPQPVTIRADFEI